MIATGTDDDKRKIIMAKTPLQTVADARENIQDDVETRLQELRDEITALTHQLRDLGLKGAHEAKAKAKDIADDATDEALHAIKELRKQFGSMQSEVEGKVQTHPFAWLVGAVGLGVILGLFLTHRD
jgi:ElaB/YqjD/DUF883 family membrane-anchored ribosome-binding protein